MQNVITYCGWRLRASRTPGVAITEDCNARATASFPPLASSASYHHTGRYKPVARVAVRRDASTSASCGAGGVAAGCSGPGQRHGGARSSNVNSSSNCDTPVAALRRTCPVLTHLATPRTSCISGRGRRASRPTQLASTSREAASTNGSCLQLPAPLFPLCTKSHQQPHHRQQEHLSDGHRRFRTSLGPNRRGASSNERGGHVICRAGVLEGFSGVSNLMAPEFATVFSAVIAITSVSINLYGGLLTEKRRAELAREVERERQMMAAQEEERSVVARYRGPLLEATVDLEARLYHIATLTGEWRSGDVVCEEEVVYTLFTLAQWLGFLEVIRREGPRERSFLQRGGGGGGGEAAAAGSSSGGSGPGGTDTLTTLVEGFRFVLSAHPATLRKWYEQGDEREHPGCRSRALMLRGTPALSDGWPDGLYGSGEFRERPPPPPGGGRRQAWARPKAAAAPYSRGPPPWITSEQVPYYGLVPPPPTRPVVLQSQRAAVVTAAVAAAGSELVIGSLDENDLAAAGLGLADMDVGPDLQELLARGGGGGEGGGAGDDSGSSDGETAPIASTASAAPAAPTAVSLLPSGSGWEAAAAAASSAAAIAAADLTVGSLGSFSTLSSLSSLSSFDEGSFAISSVGAGGGGGGGGGGRLAAPRDVFHVSRGAQRSIGSMMVVTPMGASRHYTLSYGDFYTRYYLDEFFASWLRPVHTDILALVGGRMWGGQGPFPLNRWTRLLLLQQLLVETIELLDPAHVRVPANRRVVLAPVPYKQAPELETYRARMREMSQLDSPLLMQQLQGSQASGPMGRLVGWLRYAGAAVAAVVSTAPPAPPSIAPGAQTAAPAAFPPSAPSAPTAASAVVPSAGIAAGSSNGTAPGDRSSTTPLPALPPPPPPTVAPALAPPPEQQPLPLESGSGFGGPFRR